MTTRRLGRRQRALVRLDRVITDQGRTRDAELAAQVAEGKRDALEQVYNQVGGAVKATAWRVLRDEALAEDVVQEVFMTFWRQPERYDESRGSLRVFLVTMAHRKAVDIVRSESARLRREERDPSPVQPDIEEEVWALAVGDKVRTALLELGEGERQAISLAYLEGLSYVDVAKRLGAPEGTVKSRIRSGMKKLSESLIEVRQT
jgi:RNA polymerase sigma-70 factor, ECF subfamily